MQYPYVSTPDRAFFAAHVSTAILLGSVIWTHVQKRAVRALLLVGVAIAGLTPHWIRWITSVNFQYPPYIAQLWWLLPVSSCFYAAATLFQPHRVPQAVAILAVFLTHQAGRYVTTSDPELVSLQLVLGGIVAGLVATAPESSPSPPSDRRPLPLIRHYEAALFAIGLAVASFVAVYVLDRFVASGDEWAYQYQADLFAHGKSYGPVPECPTSHQTYWVYYWMGRAFSQYTPGWPLVLAPFQRLGVYWLANPILFGITLVGVSRLARRAASGNQIHDVTTAQETTIAQEATISQEAYLAGLAGPLVMAAAGAMVLNAGSLFSHTLVCALFAWCAESIFTLTSPGLTRKGELAWGAALGACTALLLATRPSDGAVILPSIGAYGLYALAKRRLRWRAVAAVALGFVPVAVATLVILRLQLGAWFVTGYSLTEKFHPWATIEFAWPARDEWKFGVPLATGAYCFWPCSAAVAAVGIIVAYRRGRALPMVLGGAAVLINVFYSAVVAGRHADWGYGPRYVLTLLVPTAVFAGVALAPLLLQVNHKGFTPLLRAGLAGGSIAYGTLSIGGQLYGQAMAEIRAYAAPYHAVAANRLKDAVVVFGKVAQDPADLTQNLASVENPDVIYLMEGSPEEMECVRRLYPHRKWYRAEGVWDVTLSPLN